MSTIAFNPLANINLEQYLQATSRFSSISKNLSNILPSNSPINNYIQYSVSQITPNTQENEDAATGAIAYAADKLLNILSSTYELNSISNQANQTTNSSKLSELTNSYNNVLKQISSQVEESSYMGYNLLLGQQSIDSQSLNNSISIQGIDIRRNSNGLSLYTENDQYFLSKLQNTEDPNDYSKLQREITQFSNQIEKQQKYFQSSYETLNLGNSYSNSYHTNNEAALLLSNELSYKIASKALSLSSFTTQNRLRSLY